MIGLCDRPVHGGILATLANVALGYTLTSAMTPPANFVSANLTLDYASGATLSGDTAVTHADCNGSCG